MLEFLFFINIIFFITNLHPRFIHSIWYCKFYIGIFAVILMVQIETKSIILTAATIVTILILTLPSLDLNGFTQTPQILDIQSNSNIDKSEIKDNTQSELAAKSRLVPHENEFLDDYYQVSNFAFVLSNSSQLCPTVIVSMNLKMERCKRKGFMKDRYQEE